MDSKPKTPTDIRIALNIIIQESMVSSSCALVSSSHFPVFTFGGRFFLICRVLRRAIFYHLGRYNCIMASARNCGKRLALGAPTASLRPHLSSGSPNQPQSCFANVSTLIQLHSQWNLLGEKGTPIVQTPQAPAAEKGSTLGNDV